LYLLKLIQCALSTLTDLYGTVIDQDMGYIF